MNKTKIFGKNIMIKMTFIGNRNINQISQSGNIKSKKEKYETSKERKRKLFMNKRKNKEKNKSNYKSILNKSSYATISLIT